MFTFCRGCVQMTNFKEVETFVVVNPVPRKVLKEFQDFYQARDWASQYFKAARIEEHKHNVCQLCGRQE